jgi:hypothetical protein
MAGQKQHDPRGKVVPVQVHVVLTSLCVRCSFGTSPECYTDHTKYNLILPNKLADIFINKNVHNCNTAPRFPRLPTAGTVLYPTCARMNVFVKLRLQSSFIVTHISTSCTRFQRAPNESSHGHQKQTII